MCRKVLRKFCGAVHLSMEALDIKRFTLYQVITGGSQRASAGIKINGVPSTAIGVLASLDAFPLGVLL